MPRSQISTRFCLIPRPVVFLSPALTASIYGTRTKGQGPGTSASHILIKAGDLWTSYYQPHFADGEREAEWGLVLAQVHTTCKWWSRLGNRQSSCTAWQAAPTGERDSVDNAARPILVTAFPAESMGLTVSVRAALISSQVQCEIGLKLYSSSFYCTHAEQKRQSW